MQGQDNLTACTVSGGERGCICRAMHTAATDVMECWSWCVADGLFKPFE